MGEHPIRWMVVATLGWHVVVVGSAFGLPPLAPGWFPDLGAVAVNLIAFVATLIALRATGISAGFRRGEHWLLAVPMLAVVLSYAAQGLAGTPTQFLSSTTIFIAVALNEETFSRGLVQGLGAPLPPLKLGLTVAILFGVGHLQNWIFFNARLEDTVVQIIGSTAAGFCWAGLRLRTASLLPGMLVHAVDDFLQIRSPGAAPFWWQVVIMLLFAGYGYYLLSSGGRPRRRPPAPCGAHGVDPRPAP